jgi:hypothetical protein
MTPTRPLCEPKSHGGARTEQEDSPGQARKLRLTEPGFALSLQAALLVHSRCAPAATAFTTELARACGCSRVTLGFVRRSDVHLAAVSHGADGDLVGPDFELITAAMEEAFEQAATIVLPLASDATPVIRLAHSRLLQRSSGAVASIPLLYQNEVVGVVCFEWPASLPALNDIVTYLKSLLGLTGPVLYLLHERDLPLHSRATAAAGRTIRRLRTSENRRLWLALAAGVLIAVALLFIPVDYRVGGHAHIEGSVQRSVVAPMDGFLKSVAARPGDRVKQGQLLFELDNQDLMLQRRKWASELAQQENDYATATATLDRSQMVIALARADEARAQLELVDSDLARVRMVAPFDGIVIQGDLSRSLGAPTQRGTEMMVLAPSGSYRTVIEVDERDIGRLSVGQRGVLSLSALPWDSLPITITRVTPVAHLAEGTNVFDVEAEITGGEDRIRPGLAGVAKVVVGHRPLIWIWGHRLIGWLRQTVWSWLP